MKDIRIILERFELEVPNDITLPVNFQTEDLTNPTAIKVGYTKTITIEGTPHNNEIFGNIWNIERITVPVTQTNYGVYFNPSRRAECVIYRNGDVVFSGYAKLDTVDYSGEQIKYNISVYADLADFFYSLTYNESGDTKTLADLDYGYNLDFSINTTTVRQAWDSITASTINSKWNIINFDPNCYEGYPEDFSADKVLIKAYDNSIFPYSGGTQNRYTLYDGYAMGELEEEYTGLEMRDLRSYNLRPVMSIKGLFRGLQDRVNNGGYELVLDKGFFNEINPYYQKAWFTLPLLSNLDGIEGQALSGRTAASTTSVDGLIALNFVSGQITGTTLNLQGYGYGTLDLDLRIGFNLTLPQQYSNRNFYTSYWKYETYPGYYDEEGDWYPPQTNVYQGRLGAIYFKLVAVDGNNNRIAETQQYYIGNSTDWFVNRYGGTGIEGHFEYTSGTQWQFVGDNGATDFTIQLKGIPKAANITLLTETTYCYVYDSDKENIEMQWDPAEGGWQDYGHYIPQRAANKPSMYRYPSTVYFYEENNARSGSKITKDKLLGGLGTPCDYLLSYCKMFGLYFVKDKYEKKITIISRNKFYTGEIVNIDDQIDYSKDSKQTPLTYDSKWYTFKNEAVEGEYIPVYNRDYKADYAEQKINTNYNFDSEEKNLCENNVFKTAVMARGKSNYYRRFYNTSGTEVPGFYSKGFKYVLYSGGTYVDETNEQDKALNGGTYVNFYTKKGGFDCEPRLSLKDSDNGSVDGENVLLFYNGFTTPRDVEGNAIIYWLTDDLDEMFVLNDQSPCWLHTNTNISKGTVTSGYTDYYAYEYMRTGVPVLPSFGRYVLESNTITYSMDYGEPKELYIDNYNSNSASTVYTKFWKAFMNDQLSIDSRKFECNVLFPDFEESALRKLYYFKNAVWMLNKVSDYDMAGEGTSKCEFIKIVNASDYTSGQILPVDDAEITFLDDVLDEITSLSLPGIKGNGFIYAYLWNVENFEIVSSPAWFGTLYSEQDGAIYYSVNKNGDTVRTGNLVVRGNNIYTGEEVTAELAISQNTGVFSLEINPTSMIFPAERSGYFNILEITTNGTWDIEFLPGWITETHRTNNQFYFFVSENLSSSPRTAIITVSATLPGAEAKYATFTVLQNGRLN